jgi:hypothetical protein
MKYFVLKPCGFEEKNEEVYVVLDVSCQLWKCQIKNILMTNGNWMRLKSYEIHIQSYTYDFVITCVFQSVEQITTGKTIRLPVT